MKVSAHPLRQYRDRLGMTLEALAEKVGTTRAWLSRIENGEQPSPALIKRLMAETGLGADAFLQIEAAE